MIGDAEQLDELGKLYCTFGDEELRDLARGMDDLTETAQQVLKGELGRRGLEVPTPAEPAVVRRIDNFAESPLEAFAAMAPDECVFEFGEMDDAKAARKVLGEAGIESVIPSRQPGSMRGPRVVVGPGDALKAERVLARPLLRDPDDPDEEDAVFVEPMCPKCGAADPLLESVDPTNEWRCEACHHVWSDV